MTTGYTNAMTLKQVLALKEDMNNYVSSDYKITSNVKVLRFLYVIAPVNYIFPNGFSVTLKQSDILSILESFELMKETKEMQEILTQLKQCIDRSTTLKELFTQANNLDNFKELVQERISLLNTVEVTDIATGEKRLMHKYDLSTVGTYTKTLEFYSKYKGKNAHNKSIIEVYEITCLDLARQLIQLEWYLDNNIPYDIQMTDQLEIPYSAFENGVHTDKADVTDSFIVSITHPDYITSTGYYNKL